MLSEVSSLKLRLSVASLTAAVCAAGWLWNYMALESLRNRLSAGRVAVKVAFGPTGGEPAPGEFAAALRGVAKRAAAALAASKFYVDTAVSVAWLPTEAEHKGGGGAHGEVVVFVRDRASDEECFGVARAVADEAGRAGLRVLRTAVPTAPEGLPYGTIEARFGAATGVEHAF